VRGRRVAIVSFIVLAAAGVVLWLVAGERIIERWYIGRLDDSDREVRSAAARKLVELESREAVRVLLEPILTREGAQTGVERELLAEMGWFAVRDLLEAFRSERLFVRLQVLEILGAIGPEAKDAIPVIEKIDDEYLGSATVDALAKMGDPGVAALRRLQTSGSIQVQLLASQKLIELLPMGGAADS